MDHSTPPEWRKDWVITDEYKQANPNWEAVPELDPEPEAEPEIAQNGNGNTGHQPRKLDFATLVERGSRRSDQGPHARGAGLAQGYHQRFRYSQLRGIPNGAPKRRQLRQADAPPRATSSAPSPMPQDQRRS